MRNLMLALFAFLLFVAPLGATGEKEVFDRTVDYLNFKIVGLSLEKHNEGTYNDYLKRFGTYVDIGDSLSIGQVTSFLKNKKLKATVTLAEEIESIKTMYKDGFTKLSMTDFFSEGIYKNAKLPNLQNFIKGPEKDFENFKKNELTPTITEFIKKSTVNGEVATQTPDEFIADTESVEKKSTKQSSQSTTKKSMDLTKAYLIGLTALSLMLILVLYRYWNKSRKLEAKLEDITNKYRVAIDDKAQLDQKNRKLKSDREELSAQVESFAKEKLTTQEKPLHEEEFTFTEKELQEQYAPEEFFLSMPNSDGSFNNSGRKKEFNPTASMYHFTIVDKKKDIAEFRFMNHEVTLSDALNRPETYILPVCDNINALKPDAKKIITVEPGKAIFENEKWRLKDKAKIRFE